MDEDGLLCMLGDDMGRETFERRCMLRVHAVRWCPT